MSIAILNTWVTLPRDCSLVLYP